jgi:hypothetical protein
MKKKIYIGILPWQWGVGNRMCRGGRNFPTPTSFPQTELKVFFYSVAPQQAESQLAVAVSRRNPIGGSSRKRWIPLAAAVTLAKSVSGSSLTRCLIGQSSRPSTWILAGGNIPTCWFPFCLGWLLGQLNLNQVVAIPQAESRPIQGSSLASQIPPGGVNPTSWIRNYLG